jgi:ABC-type multidrug transport system ATPase subunit
MKGTAIEVNGLVKSCGGLTAVDGISFDVRTGEVLSLMGLNGIGPPFRPMTRRA